MESNVTKQNVLRRLQANVEAGAGAILFPHDAALVSEAEVRELVRKCGRSHDVVAFYAGQPKSSKCQFQVK